MVLSCLCQRTSHHVTAGALEMLPPATSGGKMKIRGTAAGSYRRQPLTIASASPTARSPVASDGRLATRSAFVEGST